MGDKSRPLVIYHADCIDGFTAAWVAHEAFRGELDLVAAAYQTAPPEVTGRCVYLVDFSYRRDVMADLVARAQRVVVLDHHRTAIAELAGLPMLESVFDEARSGARIAWDHWFAGSPPPPALLCVEDHDLWRHQRPGSREVHAALASYPHSIATWSALMSGPLQDLIREGKTLRRARATDLATLVLAGRRTLTIGDIRVPALNVPRMFSSDAGELLAAEAPFAACYCDTAQGRAFSLRSTPGQGADVSAIARAYGGGGHPHAAGFTVSFDQARAFEIE
jgi:oligoribonuclease NrnB/cAMP/cGMP phosphodiesterase (DHH superfamily)